MARPLLPFLLGLLVLAAPSLAAESLAVRRVVDGDTLLMSDGQRVRLIGIDTPEVHPSAKADKDAGGSERRKAALKELGRRASAFVKEIAEGRKARLEFDPSNAAAGHRDRYGRVLAYVFIELPDCDEIEPWAADDACDCDTYDEGFLNGLIIEAGYGSPFTRYPFRHADRFRALNEAARKAKRGLWRPEGIEARRPTESPSRTRLSMALNESVYLP